MLKNLKVTINYKGLKEKCLMQSWDYSDYEATETIKDIRAMSKPVFAAFWKWYSKGEIPKGYLCGVDFSGLVTEHQMNPVAAFLYIDWYQKEPEEAYASLSRGLKDKDDLAADKGRLAELLDKLPEEKRQAITRPEPENTENIARDITTED